MRPVRHVVSLSQRGNMATRRYTDMENTVTLPNDTSRIIREETNGGIDSIVVYLHASPEKK